MFRVRRVNNYQCVFLELPNAVLSQFIWSGLFNLQINLFFSVLFRASEYIQWHLEYIAMPESHQEIWSRKQSSGSLLLKASQ